MRDAGCRVARHMRFAVAWHWIGFPFSNGATDHRRDGDGACVTSFALGDFQQIQTGQVEIVNAPKGMVCQSLREIPIDNVADFE